MRGTWRGAVVVAGIVVGVGCHGGDKGEPTGEDGPCDPVSEEGCDAGEVCEEVAGGEPTCFAPVRIEGRVFDTSDDAGIPDARVVAQDANGAAVSPVAVTGPDGSYALAVPALREADGRPVAGALHTLRADALGYQGFPEAPRAALPIDLGDATGDPPVVSNAGTDVGLVALPDAADLGAVAGLVRAERPGGALVVVAGASAVADRDGDFVVFNVPPGTHEVAGFLTGSQLEPESVDVAGGTTTGGVVLDEVGEATATVSGTVQIVNAPGGSVTTVILVVEDTFDEDAIRGEAPPGLRAAGVTGSWSIEGVPDGRYVALAAYEDDALVRDPDTSIGGTDLVHLEVAGGDVVLDGFKVTEALEILSPGASLPEEVTAPPVLTWVDDSSEDEYHVVVRDALGALVWETRGDFDPGGNDPVEVPYGGPLDRGMYYQFRVTSLKDGVPLSTTEDLEGVFFRP